MNEEEILKIMEELKESVRYKTIIPNEERNEWKREFDAIQGLLDLYYKQQKEIEELKHDNSILCEIAYTGKRIQLPYTMVYTGTDNFISKDKIREIREKYKKERANMTQIIFSKYGKTQQTFNQAVVNEVIKALDEILGE